MPSDCSGSGMGLRSMRVTSSTEMPSSTAMRDVGRGDADEGDGQSTRGRADDGRRRPRAAGQRGTSGGVLDGDDLRLEGHQRRSLEAGRDADQEDHREDARRRRCPRR